MRAQLLPIPNLQQIDKDRFWSKVAITSNQKKCWEWTAGISTSGYGAFRFKNIKLTAHRLAFFLYFNNSPNQLLVCHHCDNRLCCNPHHMFLGTDLDNSKDKEAKNRGNHCAAHNILKGSQSKTSKLNESDIPKIINLYFEDNLQDRQIASIYNVSTITIWNICNRKTWKHVHVQFTDEFLRIKRKELITQFKKKMERPTIMGANNKSAKLIESDIHEIVRLRTIEKKQHKDIAELYGINRRTVERICMRKTWKHVKIN